MKFKRVRNTSEYTISSPVTENDIFSMARLLANKKLSTGKVINRPSDTYVYLQALMSKYEREVFGSLFLDSKNRIICFEEQFQGSLTTTSIHPREVVKRALVLNAAAVVLVHNHPSGDPTPSEADKQITILLREALHLIDVCVLDHIVVGVRECVSMTEKQLI